jgi:hypothetical protein
MAILYGTQSNGVTLPVLVDQFGNLLAKGIDGQPGTPGIPGPPGEPGPPGGSFPLPPDPYEGAYLGWLNNGLAWVGTPPSPFPDGVFGPITGWDPAGVLTVEGVIPDQVNPGVYIYQCNEDGSIFVNGWNNSQAWSLITTVSNSTSGTIQELYNDNLSNGIGGVSSSSPGSDAGVVLQWQSLAYAEKLEVYVQNGSAIATKLNNGSWVSGTGDSSYQWVTLGTGVGSVETIAVKENRSNAGFDIRGIKIDGKVLVDSGIYPTAPNLNLLINSIDQNTLLGVPNRTNDFTIGKYLRVPESNVARQFYDGN